MFSEKPVIPNGKLMEIPDFPGYFIGTDGSVWSKFAQKGKKGQRARYHLSNSWRRLKTPPHSKENPYPVVGLYKDGRMTQFSVHVLMLTTFVGPRPEGCQCLHWDGDPTNCSIENLRWGTPIENAADKIRHGRSCRGQTNGYAKLTAEKVLSIRSKIKQRISYIKIAQEFDVSLAIIGHIATGRNWGWLR